MNKVAVFNSVLLLLIAWKVVTISANPRPFVKVSPSLRLKAGATNDDANTASSNQLPRSEQQRMFTSTLTAHERRKMDWSNAINHLSKLSHAARKDPQILAKQPIEVRLREVLASCPFLALQWVIFTLVLVNFGADVCGIVPVPFQQRLRVQNHLTAIAALLIDIFRAVDLSNSYLLETMEDMTDVNDAAVKEVQLVVKESAISHSIAFLCICLLAGCKNKLMLLPLIITEMPLLLRGIVVAAWITAPVLVGGYFHRFNTGATESTGTFLQRWLFPSADKTTSNATASENNGVDSTATALLDDTCSVVGFVAELQQLLLILVDCLRVKSSGQVRGSKDLLLLVVKLLLLLNYLIVRARSFLRSGAISTVLTLDAVRSNETLSQVLHMLEKYLRKLSGLLSQVSSGVDTSDAYEGTEGKTSSSQQRTKREGMSTTPTETSAAATATAASTKLNKRSTNDNGGEEIVIDSSNKMRKPKNSRINSSSGKGEKKKKKKQQRTA